MAQPQPTVLVNRGEQPMVFRSQKRGIVLKVGRNEIAPTDMAALKKSKAFVAACQRKDSPIELPGASAAGLLG
jgi:hypothetical protein